MMRFIKSTAHVLLCTIQYLVSVLIKLVLGIAAILALIVLVIYAMADSTKPEMVPRLDALVTTFHGYGISYYQDQDWCESVRVESAEYANSTASTCGVGDEKTPFNGSGTALFAKAREAAKKAKIAPVRLSVQSAQGSVSFAQIDLSCFLCYASYVYSPLTKYQPDAAEKASVTEMGGGWYYVTTGI
ncbi:hypothetical protein JFT91_13640 [Pseudomonas sp. TH08]|uniref:hypothetical protein n=1 Tax=unclassified Pseudomonas TaxID=196821 RepID=UPI0019135C89|nr:MULTISPECIES: hypothetical protein [unclassified Pseudomonas]MBK5529171.1 hypothetical protein [Pseudomonas sp. TH06]MBK5533626.1 hypothetical protein [Pseudomonas sp. TH08]